LSLGVPVLIADAVEHATRRFLECFAATIRNKNTRMAYYRVVGRFFAWCDHLDAVGVKRPAVDKPSSGSYYSPSEAMLAVVQLTHHVRAGHREMQSPCILLARRGTKGDVVPVA
jgi:hypothetical protein